MKGRKPGAPIRLTRARRRAARASCSTRADERSRRRTARDHRRARRARRAAAREAARQGHDLAARARAAAPRPGSPSRSRSTTPSPVTAGQGPPHRGDRDDRPRRQRRPDRRRAPEGASGAARKGADLVLVPARATPPMRGPPRTGASRSLRSARSARRSRARRARAGCVDSAAFPLVAGILRAGRWIGSGRAARVSRVEEATDHHLRRLLLQARAAVRAAAGRALPDVPPGQHRRARAAAAGAARAAAARGRARRRAPSSASASASGPRRLARACARR